MITALLFQILSNKIGEAVDPRCECLLYSRTFGKDFGTFSSPDYPRPYSPFIGCILYTFVAEPHEIVEITFKDFNVYRIHPSCSESDFVKVFAHIEDGNVNEHTPSDNILCGRYSDIPRMIYSSGPTLVLEFYSSNRSTNATGFIGTFRFLDRRSFITDGKKVPGTKCDMEFISGNTSQEGRFYSPRYPASYPKSIRCSYHFRARFNERVWITFDEVMLQRGDESCISRADVIKVYDGYSKSNNILMICNEAVKVEIFSIGPTLHVEFESNNRWPGKGFKASYHFHQFNQFTTFNELLPSEFRKNSGDRANMLPKMFGMNLNHISNGNPYGVQKSSCDAFFRSIDQKNGSFSSPDYPRPYKVNSRCLFVFQAVGRERVRITFQDFSLSKNMQIRLPDCKDSDTVTIYDKLQGRMDKITTLCFAQIPTIIMSSSSILAVEFDAKYSYSESRGFKASYSFIENFGITTGQQLKNAPCVFRFNSSIHGKTGVFFSPNFPGSYPRDTECHYFFYAEYLEYIEIEFTYFDIEGIPPCDEYSESDFIELSSYLAHDNSYRRYCGRLLPFNVSSSKPFFRVSFKSNLALDGVGFNATYRFISKIEIETKTEIVIVNEEETSNAQDVLKPVFIVHANLLITFYFYRYFSED